MRNKVLTGLLSITLIGVSYPVWKPFAKRNKRRTVPDGNVSGARNPNT